MKKIILISALSILSIEVASQTASNTENSDSTNIYFQALRVICEAYAANGYEELFIEQSIFTTRNLPSEIAGVYLSYLDKNSIYKMTKRNKHIQMFRIIPLRLKNKEFYVTIILFEVSRKRKKFFYTNKGGDDIKFKYDCHSGHLVFQE